MIVYTIAEMKADGWVRRQDIKPFKTPREAEKWKEAQPNNDKFEVRPLQEN
jgi:hypothetical protein